MCSARRHVSQAVRTLLQVVKDVKQCTWFEMRLLEFGREQQRTGQHDGHGVRA